MTNISCNSAEGEIQNTSQDVRTMGCIGRTQGDGMENVAAERSKAKQSKLSLADSLIYHPIHLKPLASIPPVTPTGTIVNLVPKHIANTKDKRNIMNSLKSKEPKFVPYEPYKAAVNPITPYVKQNTKIQRDDVCVNMAISQVAAMKICETDLCITETLKEDANQSVGDKWLKDKREHEAELQKLKEENRQLENQLKLQAQVNGELKNLLVAAVGEDLETRVHLLTEDKVQLARALLNSDQHLFTHQEQTEWLAGQCEVWRSKFLASSLMVEELAKCKARLSQRAIDLEDAIRRLLDDRRLIRDLSLKIYRTLNILREKFDPVGISYEKTRIPSANILDLQQGCYQLAEILKIQLLSGIENIGIQNEMKITGLNTTTPAEKIAEQLLANPISHSTKLLISGTQDVACSAVMGAAVAIGGKIFLPGDVSNVACCPHCSGKMEQI